MRSVSAADVFSDRRDLDGRLTTAQTAMTLQDETIKRADRDRCQLIERLNSTERSLAAADNEKRLLQVTQRIFIAFNSCFNGFRERCYAYDKNRVSL